MKIFVDLKFHVKFFHNLFQPLDTLQIGTRHKIPLNYLKETLPAFPNLRKLDWSRNYSDTDNCNDGVLTLVGLHLKNLQ